MDQPFQYCADRVREDDKDRFLATLFAPERCRGPLFALYAFNIDITQVRDRITSPLPGELRLQWWRDVLTGINRTDAAGNPIAAGLMRTVRRNTLPVSALVDLIDAHTFDLYDEPMATLAALERYATRTAATTFRLAAQILNDGADPGCETACEHAGMACTVGALLWQLPVHSVRGQRYVPNDILAKYGANTADIHAGRTTGALQSALADLRQIAGDHLEALKTQGEGVTSDLLPAFLPAALVASALAALERNGDSFHPHAVPQWRRQWMLWRAARNPKRFIRIKPDGPEGSVGRR